MPLTRRALFASLGTTAFAGLAGAAAVDDRRSRLGFVTHSFPVHNAADRCFSRPARFLNYCRGLGAGTVQVDLGPLSGDEADALRDSAAAAGMILEGSVSPPRDDSDLDRFEAEIRTAKRAGAGVVRTVMMRGRRYETLETEAAYLKFAEVALHSLNLAAPVVTKHGVRLAIENHKDWRADELVGLLKRVGCDHLGVCVDTGNSLALLEEPWETVEALAPHAFSCHLKDMAVEESADGFLLSEVSFGTGVVDLPRTVSALRKANPEIAFQIEMITRDPLKIPCLTDRYWATFPSLPGRHLARALSFVRAHPPQNPLPRVSTLSPADRLKAENENIHQCFEYGRGRLGI